MAASSAKIFDISDVGPVETTGGDVTNLQEAAEKGLGTFLEAVGVGLSSRYLKKLVDAGFDVVRSLAVDEDKLIKYGEMLPGHAIRVSEAAIEVVSGKLQRMPNTRQSLGISLMISRVVRTRVNF